MPRMCPSGQSYNSVSGVCENSSGGNYRRGGKFHMGGNIPSHMHDCGAYTAASHCLGQGSGGAGYCTWCGDMNGYCTEAYNGCPSSIPNKSFKPRRRRPAIPVPRPPGPGLPPPNTPPYRQQVGPKKKVTPFPVCASLNQQCSPPGITHQGPSCCPGLYCADPGWDQYGPQYGFTCQELGSQWNDSTDCIPPGYNCTHSPACCSGFCHQTQPTLNNPYPTGGTCM